MPKRQIFFSFHYDADCKRVQQIRNIGAIEGAPIASPNDWEKIQRQGDNAIRHWIDNGLQNRSCTIVLIGEKTAGRKWIEYEIRKSFNDKKGLFGIHIHNLESIDGRSHKGINPFSKISMKSGDTLADYITVYDPKQSDAYNDIANNIEKWIETAIQEASDRR